MGGEHRCEWRDQAESLASQLVAAHQTIAAQSATVAAQSETIRQQSESLAKLGEQLTAVQATVEKLQRHVFGARSEKMPSVAKEIRDPARAEADRIAALRTRRENAEKKRQLVTRTIEHKVREDQKVCPKCGGYDFSRLGGGEKTEMYELIPSRVERQIHVQEKLRCRCGEAIITADPPAKVYDKARFGPTFMAQVVVSKCADSLPLYRQAKAYRRAGVQVDDSTLGELFHRVAAATKPLSQPAPARRREGERARRRDHAARAEQGKDAHSLALELHRARRGREGDHLVCLLAQPLRRDAGARARRHGRQARR